MSDFDEAFEEKFRPMISELADDIGEDKEEVEDMLYAVAKWGFDLANRESTPSCFDESELEEKLCKLICHATGGRMSYATYAWEAMRSAVDDYIEECIEKARSEKGGSRERE